MVTNFWSQILGSNPQLSATLSPILQRLATTLQNAGVDPSTAGLPPTIGASNFDNFAGGPTGVDPSVVGSPATGPSDASGAPVASTGADANIVSGSDVSSSSVGGPTMIGDNGLPFPSAVGATDPNINSSVPEHTIIGGDGVPLPNPPGVDWAGQMDPNMVQLDGPVAPHMFDPGPAPLAPHVNDPGPAPIPPHVVDPGPLATPGSGNDPNLLVDANGASLPNSPSWFSLLGLDPNVAGHSWFDAIGTSTAPAGADATVQRLVQALATLPSDGTMANASPLTQTTDGAGLNGALAAHWH